MHNTPDSAAGNTPSHMDSYTPHTPTTSLRPQTLSLATSSRPPIFLVPLPSGSRSDNLSITSIADVRPLMWGYKF